MKRTAVLDATDEASPCWQKLKAHYERRLADYRLRLEMPSLTDNESAVLRGRIAEVKALLAINNELPSIPNEQQRPLSAGY